MIQVNLDRLLDRIEKLSQIGKQVGAGTTRLALSSEDKAWGSFVGFGIYVVRFFAEGPASPEIYSYPLAAEIGRLVGQIIGGAFAGGVVAAIRNLFIR